MPHSGVQPLLTPPDLCRRERTDDLSPQQPPCASPVVRVTTSGRSGTNEAERRGRPLGREPEPGALRPAFHRTPGARYPCVGPLREDGMTRSCAEYALRIGRCAHESSTCRIHHRCGCRPVRRVSRPTEPRGASYRTRADVRRRGASGNARTSSRSHRTRVPFQISRSTIELGRRLFRAPVRAG